MSGKATYKTLDGNEAVARIAYRLNEVIAIYPITPASSMGEWADAWAAAKSPNLWGTVPHVIEMQSEGGAAGAVHGALQTGTLTTTFTASQGLLLMLPNMFKIAGELTPTVFHIAARSLAAQALSIFGDHSDVMTARGTGWAMLSSASVQEAHDMALIAHAATLATRIPFLHFFDGFRTSHEVSKIELIPDDVIREMICDEWVYAHRARALSPENPVIRGTAQNPDVYFQARESSNSFYLETPEIVQQLMDQFGDLTGRYYNLYEYYGADNADRVIVAMGSGVEAIHETVDALNAQGERVGVLKLRLFRPFDMRSFVKALPATTQVVTVLDRTKEPGSAGEPLYLDCVAALYEEWQNGPIPLVTGGRYGLSSKEFTPAMIKAVYDEMRYSNPRNHFTVGINDDVTQTSLEYDPTFSIEPDNVIRAIFYGLGSDGTVGANKNSIKIIGENTDNYAQGYFVYDSKKSGSVTVSHLRFGPDKIRSTYLIDRANFVACHQPIFLDRYDMLQYLEDGGTFLLNSPFNVDKVWDAFPQEVQDQILEKNLRVYVINASKVARETGMGSRINTIMQTCFFAISGVLEREEALSKIKAAIQKEYARKGEDVVQKNLAAVDAALEYLYELDIPAYANSTTTRRAPVVDAAPDFVHKVIGKMIVRQGDELPVSALPIDGTYPSGTSQWEKRDLADELPVWDPDLCIQCGKCAFVCPHAVIRIKAYEEELLAEAPDGFKAVPARDRNWDGLQYTIQVSPEDCTACGICVDVCPAKSKVNPELKALNMENIPSETETANWDFFMNIPDMDRRNVKVNSIRQQQVQRPLFEFSGACSGCGETPYLKLMSQLFGDRSVIANATGCSSIFGGNLPTTPWSYNDDGRGPAWANSLFEDNAEFGLGMRVSIDKQTEYARELLQQLAAEVGQELADDILNAVQNDEADIYDQRQRVALLRERLEMLDTVEAETLLTVVDTLVKRTVWIVGGDGWAYDIGYGGLDHVLASGQNVNILVLDTEVYSNTGGQASKATPRAAVAKFAAGGKVSGKKDLGLIAMTYGNVYVAQVAMGAKDEHTLRVFLEAEAYPGPSLIIAYSHCIAHGINMGTGMHDQKAAVQSGDWPLYRYNPQLEEQGKNPFQLDSRKPTMPLKEYMAMENRFRQLTKKDPETAEVLMAAAQEDANKRWAFYEYLAKREN